MKKILNIKLISVFLFYFLSQSLFAFPGDKDSISFIKQGGVCFRYDDNTSASTYFKLAEIFDKYGAKFSLSLNFGSFYSTLYADSIRLIQEMGHEIMDHTPNHRTNFIKTVFPRSDYTANTKTGFRDGIDHVKDQKLCLSFEEPDLNKATRNDIGNINGNILTGNINELSKDEKYIYIEQFKELFFILDSSNKDSIIISDIWEDEINLPPLISISYFIFRLQDIHITSDALNILGEESIKLATLYNIQPPKVWIQPGGDFPHIKSHKLKNVMGANLNYVAGAAVDKGKQVYNEYDPLNDQRFEMQWGDFFEDYWTLEECKNTIADRVAKHYLQIGHTHFYDLPDGFDAYYSKIDSLLSWLTTNNIPVKTYSEWAEILYGLDNDPYKNIFPPLNVDLDKNMSELDINGVPDGYARRYWDGQGQWEIDTIINDKPKYCYSVSGDYRLCRVDNLAGVEKGNNEFRIKTKGEPGDSVIVRFEFSDTTTSSDIEFEFPADTKEWTEYSVSDLENGDQQLIIPDNESLISIDIYCSAYTTGKVKITDMFLAKAQLTSVTEQNEISPNSFSLDQNYPNPFNPETKIKYSLNKTDDVKIKIYDVLGSEVTTLVDVNQKAGSYEINFDGSDLSSGVYFYTLSAGKALQTKKMILLK